MVKRILIFLLITQVAKSQDRLFFVNGGKQTGYLVSIGKDVVFFKKNDTAKVEQIKKSELLLVEDYKGTRYIISNEEKKKSPSNTPKNTTLKLNALRVQPLAGFIGRATLLYERLNKNQSVGVVIPLIITFNPGIGNLNDSIKTESNKGTGLITGLDVNFYLGSMEKTNFFIGPRFRIGTDVLFDNTQAATLQTQCGWNFGGNDYFHQQLSFGFGVIKILSTGISSNFPKQFFGWYSINYSLGVRW